MLNTPIQPMMYGVPQAVQGMQNIQPQTCQTTSLQDQKGTLRGQSMAITSDIQAEYSAVTRLNDILVSLANDIKTQKDPEQKKFLEARVNTINQMILQREMKINQMEMARTQIDAQLKD